MTLAATVINSSLRLLTRMACKVEDSQLARVPQRGPLILVFNHINSLEVPLVYSHLMPRPITGLAKVETWDNPIFRPLFNMWGIIPIQRGEADTTAFRRSLQALENGHILAIAPEGTRSKHGRLQKGHPGVVLLALRSGAPILPMIFFGGENFNRNLGRLQRTQFNIVVGEKFYLNPGDVKIDHHIRLQMVDEIMYKLAELLPPAYRGKYSDLSQATNLYLSPLPPANTCTA